MNPAAGRGGANVRLDRALGGLPGAEVRFTEGSGSAAQLAVAAARSGCEPLVLAGGDGLLHEVVNALLPLPQAERPCLGLIPTGTGNDFGRCLEIPRQPEGAVRVIRGGRVRALDAIRLRLGRKAADEGTVPDGGSGPRYMLNMAVTGYAGRVARRATRAIKRRWGGWAYKLASIAELPRLTAVMTELELDEETISIPTYAVAVANGQFVGGGIPILPEARPDDGWLDVLAVPALPTAAAVAMLPRILLGRHGGKHRLVVRRARRVRVRTKGPLWLNVDGENLDATTAEFEILPGALRFLVP